MANAGKEKLFTESSKYRQVLKLAGEPPVLPAEKGTTRIRWVTVPTFQSPVLGTVSMDSRSAIMEIKTIAGAGGYQLAGLQTRMRRKMSPSERQQWNELARLFVRTHPARVRDKPMDAVDGYYSVIEITSDEGHGIVERYCFFPGNDEPALRGIFEMCDRYTSGFFRGDWSGSFVGTGGGCRKGKRGLYSGR